MQADTLLGAALASSYFTEKQKRSNLVPAACHFDMLDVAVALAAAIAAAFGTEIAVDSSPMPTRR